MTSLLLAILDYRSEKLRARLCDGTGLEIKAARELMRQAMVELYELGHWREHPEQLHGYMHIYRSCERAPISA